MFRPPFIYIGNQLIDLLDNILIIQGICGGYVEWSQAEIPQLMDAAQRARTHCKMLI